MKRSIIGLMMVGCMMSACGSDNKNENNNEEDMNNQNLSNNQNNRNNDDGEHRIDVIKFKYVTDDGRELNDVNLYFDNKLEMFVNNIDFNNVEEIKLKPDVFNIIKKTDFYLDENCTKPIYQVQTNITGIYKTYDFLREHKNRDVFQYDENYYYIEKENRNKINIEENRDYYRMYDDCIKLAGIFYKEYQYYNISQINSFKMNDFETINIVKE